ncbi:unnamed protein product, partial [Prorocentrum cordatum]
RRPAAAARALAARGVPAASAAAAELPGELRHQYFALRHGESEANVAGIIISDPAVGTAKYGLTPAGREAVALSAGAFAAEAEGRGELGGSLLVVASDFRRTCETAEVFIEALRPRLSQAGGSVEMRRAEGLRERWFGELEGGPNTAYEEVWSHDREDPSSRPRRAESALSVVARTVALVRRLEKEEL